MQRGTGLTADTETATAGQSLVFVLVILALVTLFVGGMLTLAANSLRIASAGSAHLAQAYAADAGIEAVLATLTVQPGAYDGRPESVVTLPAINGYPVTVTVRPLTGLAETPAVSSAAPRAAVGAPALPRWFDLESVAGSRAVRARVGVSGTVWIVSWQWSSP